MPPGGTKVNDPHSIIEESPGPITADSLAAESTRAGGVFGKNPNSEPQGVTGSHSTFTTTNTSGATRLDPASDAEARMAQNDWAEERKLSAAASSIDAQGRESGEAMGNASPSQQRKHHGRVQGPKGANLQEGGFDSDDRKNASFTADIGTENDPGRAAAQTIQTLNADGSAGIPRQRNLSGETPYKSLDNETAA